MGGHKVRSPFFSLSQGGAETQALRQLSTSGALARVHGPGWMARCTLQGGGVEGELQLATCPGARGPEIWLLGTMAQRTSGRDTVTCLLEVAKEGWVQLVAGLSPHRIGLGSGGQTGQDWEPRKRCSCD